METFTIRSLNFSRERDIADELLDELHQSEQGYNPHTAQWKDIRTAYLNFIASCIDEDNGCFLVAEIDGRSIGFIFGYIDQQDESNFEKGEGDDLYVSEGYVKKEYRKMGVYTALNKAFEARYKDFNIRRVYRYTLANNSVMQGWLEKQGYRPVRYVYEKWLK